MVREAVEIFGCRELRVTGPDGHTDEYQRWGWCSMCKRPSETRIRHDNWMIPGVGDEGPETDYCGFRALEYRDNWSGCRRDGCQGRRTRGVYALLLWCYKMHCPHDERHLAWPVSGADGYFTRQPKRYRR